MTPLEEAVARIIDPEAWHWAHDIDSSTRRTSLRKAKKILALPEIAKMQEALKAFSNLHDDVLRGRDYVPDDAALVLTTLNGGIIDTSNRIEAGDLRRAREANAALQPLKKEGK